MHVLNLPSVARIMKGPGLRLPDASPHLDPSLSDALTGRRSVRSFPGGRLGAEQVANLLHFAVGHRGFEFSSSYGVVQKRNYPSAGAAHSLELYLLMQAATDLPQGLFHCRYDCKWLTPMSCAPIEAIKGAFLSQSHWVARAPALLLMTAVAERLRIRYPEKHATLALLEAGHLAQNLSLTAHALGLDTCSVREWRDEALNRMLGIDGVDETLVYALAIG